MQEHQLLILMQVSSTDASVAMVKLRVLWTFMFTSDDFLSVLGFYVVITLAGVKLPWMPHYHLNLFHTTISIDRMRETLLFDNGASAVCLVFDAELIILLIFQIFQFCETHRHAALKW